MKRSWTNCSPARSTANGSIGSVGFFFDVVDLRDCQAVYTATSAGSVQAFHRQAGAESYPAAGIFKAPVKVNDEITLDIAARGQKLNVWVNGDLAIVFTMPVARRDGTFAIWTHAGTAEFSELLIDPLPADVRLAETVSEKARSPFTPPNGEDLQRAVETGRRAVALAEKKLATARADLAALEARVAAEQAKIGNAAEAGLLAVAAATAEVIDPRNPRTARIAVNHIWLRHFGQALVPSVANFGLNGDRPSHPELLDWLAAELIESGWKMKTLHRLIVLSNTYRQESKERRAESGEPDAAPISTQGTAQFHSGPPLSAHRSPPLLDPDNRYLWRMNSRRMESEVVRDSVLYAANQLDLLSC